MIFFLLEVYMVPYCKPGKRRCSVSKQCITKKGARKTICKKGSRKCANNKCYKNNKSVKSRNNFNKKYM